MKKPFQVVRINTKPPLGSRRELLMKMSKEKDHSARNKLLQNALYPNRLKRIDEDQS